MPDHPGFLQAIGDEPEDDTPRLIYADWLEDHGEAERAEFIRLQCRAAMLPWDEERDALEDRADDLLDRCEDGWLGSLADVLTDWRFERGFLEFARLSCERFRERVDDLVRVGPACRMRMGRESRDGNLSAVMRWSELERITGLDLTEMLTGPGCAYVARSPFVTRLRHLDLLGTAILRPDPFPLADLGALASNSAYGKLRSLCLNWRGVNDRGLKALMSSPVLTGLRSLSLGDNPITDQGVRILAKSAHLKNLNALHLRGTHVCADSIRELAESPHLTCLRDLSLSSHEYAGCAGRLMLSALMGTDLLGRLERLSLEIDTRQGGDLQALISLKGPFALTALDLRHSQFGFVSLMSLVCSSLLENIEALDLSSCHFDACDLNDLSQLSHLVRLRSLYLASSAIQDAGAEHLARGGCVSWLRFLDLSRARLGAAGLTALLDGLEGNRLRSLKLADNPLQDGGLERLAGAPGLGRLRELDLSRTGATAEGVQQLLASTSLPRLRVLRLSGTDLEGLNVEELLGSPVVAGLRMLDLSSTRRLTGDDIDDLKDALGRRVNLAYAGDDC